ncbi:MAG: hypothetical protein PWR00_1291 [Thermovirga sp.]|jgi:prepilin-type N-terminal cleavage/methylation domain-containing protein|nr:hypothetical protein [Thermovirga sp.]
MEKGSKAKGFTLVELLITMVILSIIAGAIITLGSTYVLHFEQADDLSMARQRGIMVLTYLENRVLHAGLGMPAAGAASTDFATNFHDLLSGTHSAELTDFAHAVNVTSGDRVLAIAYALPSGLYTVDSHDCEYGVDVDVELSSNVDTTKVTNDGNKTEGWVTFPAFGRAFLVKGVVGATVTLEPKLEAFLPANDEMYYVRFLRAYAQGGKFYAEDVTRQAAQPVVEGIVDAVFYWDEGTRTLTAAILARGNTRKGVLIAPENLPGWEDADGNPLTIPEEARHYHLSVTRREWRLRN